MAGNKGYGQFCPVAKASEIVAERWTPLVLREMIAGSHRFNQLRRGLPLISPALLAQRLKELEHAGVIERRAGQGRNAEYYLTESGHELSPIIEALGNWGARWTRSRLTAGDYDAGLLVWDMRRNIDAAQFPATGRVAIELRLDGAERTYRRWWLVVNDGEVDVCLTDPGYEVDLHVAVHLRTLIDVWIGHVPLGAAVRSGKISFDGPRAMAAAFQRSLKLSPFARAASEVA